jgi:hypothetical protein
MSPSMIADSTLRFLGGSCSSFGRAIGFWKLETIRLNRSSPTAIYVFVSNLVRRPARLVSILASQIATTGDNTDGRCSTLTATALRRKTTHAKPPCAETLPISFGQLSIRLILRGDYP